MSDPQIVVNPSSTPTTFDAILGQFVPLLSGALGTYLHLSNQDAGALVAAAVAVLGVAWRVYRARSLHAKTVVLASAAPNSVAVVKK